jgi:hypothetical protein
MGAEALAVVVAVRFAGGVEMRGVVVH